MRKARNTRLMGAILAALVLPIPSVLAQPPDQEALAKQLVGQNVRDQSTALEIALSMGPRNAGPELRAALIRALQREAQIQTGRYHAGGRGEPFQPQEDPELILRLARAVADLQDPAAIPALAATLGTGFTVIRALTGFGEQAAPAVLQVVTSPESSHYAVDDGLVALRMMVEVAAARPLSAAIREQIRVVARQRLTTPGGIISTGVTLRSAIDLAMVLDDPELTLIVSALAYDSQEVVARGVTDPELIRRTQQRALDRLAGIPPQPRR